MRRIPVQTYARIAGVLLLVSFVAGGFGEAYVPGRIIVANDATATAENIRTLGSLFRWGFVGYLAEATCDLGLALLFYVLLRPIQNEVALFTAFLGIVSTTLFAVAEFCGFGALHVLGGASYLRTFSPDQLNTLALLLLRMYGIGAVVFAVFYGLCWVLRAWLIYRAGYLPRALGVLLAFGGLGFIARSFAFVLAPAYPSGYLLLLLVPGGLGLCAWLLVKGVDVPKWEEQAQTSADWVRPSRWT